MNMKKNHTINAQSVKALLILTCTLIVFILPALAQIDDFDDPGDNDLPIDGGLSVLIAAGVGYGARKINAYKKNNSFKK